MLEATVAVVPTGEPPVLLTPVMVTVWAAEKPAPLEFPVTVMVKILFEEGSTVATVPVACVAPVALMLTASPTT